jgi:hypothetical protein
MNNTLKLILAVVIVGFLFSSCDKKEATQSENGPSGAAKAANNYENTGILFQYPSSWHSARSEAVTAMRTQLTNELRNFNRSLIAFDMFFSSDEEVALLVSKVQTDNALSAVDILAERGKVYDDATRAGDVTKINKLETITVKNLPAVVEDVERSNGGRGHTVKLLNGKYIVELSLIVNNKARYENHVGEYENILASLKLQEEKGEIKASNFSKSGSNNVIDIGGSIIQVTRNNPLHEKTYYDITNTVLTGNMYDAVESRFLMSQDQMQKFKQFASQVDVYDEKSRVFITGKFIELVGKDLAKRIGLIFLDSNGRPIYVWPADLKI